jgi:predicted dehydrogenase
MDKIRTAVVGVGYLGRFHAEKHALLPEAELVAVLDTDRVKCEALARKLGTRAVTDYREILDRVDAVSIVVPTQHHYEVAREFLERGVHVLLEKPITTTLEEADELVRIAAERNLVFQVGHLERFNPAVEAVETMIREPRFIEVQRLGSFSSRSLDIDVVLDLMIHDLDIIMALIKDEVGMIRASGIHVLSDKIDIATARLEFKGGCVATLTASRVHQGKVRKLRIFEPTVYYSIDYIDQEVVVFPLDRRQTDIKTLKIQKEEPLKKELRNFLDCIRLGKTSKVTGEEGLRALRLAHGVLREAKT